MQTHFQSPCILCRANAARRLRIARGHATVYTNLDREFICTNVGGMNLIKKKSIFQNLPYQ